ncbi:SGNH/GDSL hydrolase family protein [Actinoplanes sp. NPDC020271]|uniref:SGNH/GDSL hydrolase family protein n=1 Tax=Actinoplanes sp. NPDC020271 TaxID=3363896 RepID=UPI0037B997F7
MVINFAVLGDSIAYGLGASREADTVTARLSADLAAGGVPHRTRVLAVPGARSSGLSTQVATALTWPPHLALIIIGANDLTRFVPPAEAAAQLESAVRALRAVNAEVVVAPAPDLSVVPWVPAGMRATVRAASTLMHDAQAGAALTAGAHVADIGMSSAAGFARNRGLFSADSFHPSSAGYAVIAEALTPAVRAVAGRLAR